MGPDGTIFDLEVLDDWCDFLWTALEFDPDRFLDDRAKTYLVHNPFILFLSTLAHVSVLDNRSVLFPFSLKPSCDTPYSSHTTKCRLCSSAFYKPSHQSAFTSMLNRRRPGLLLRGRMPKVDKPSKKCYPRSHLTLYANVCHLRYLAWFDFNIVVTGRVMGKDGRG